jgi:hypothetical protein
MAGEGGWAASSRQVAVGSKLRLVRDLQKTLSIDSRLVTVDRGLSAYRYFTTIIFLTITAPAARSS